MYPDRDTFCLTSNVPRSGRDTLQHVIKACWKVAWQKGGKHCQLSFSWMNTATQTRNLKLIKRGRFLKLSQTEFPEEKQQLLEEKDADNTRKVLCKSFIQWFWELIRLGRSIFIPIPPLWMSTLSRQLVGIRFPRDRQKDQQQQQQQSEVVGICSSTGGDRKKMDR